MKENLFRFVVRFLVVEKEKTNQKKPNQEKTNQKKPNQKKTNQKKPNQKEIIFPPGFWTVLKHFSTYKFDL